MQNQKDNSRQQCQGMYSRKAWGGDTDPFVLTKFSKTTPKDGEDPVVSLVIYEWRDEDLVGVWPTQDAAEVRLPDMAFANRSLTLRRRNISAQNRTSRNLSAMSLRSALS